MKIYNALPATVIDHQNNLQRVKANSNAIQDYLSDFAIQRQPMTIQNGVAMIDVQGYLGSNLPNVEKWLGASDYSDIRNEIELAERDPNCKGIMININSGGGEAIGCVELGEFITGCKKPKVAFTGSIACSAAYAIACGCDSIIATPSALVGSVGSIMTTYSIARKAESMGEDFYVYTSEGADLKAAGNPMKKPSEDEDEYLRELTNSFGLAFRDFVVSRRNPDESALRGQAMLGSVGKKKKIVDSVGTKQDALDILGLLV